MSDHEALEFDLGFEEIPVKLRDKDGTVREYVLREMDGEQRDAYMQDLGARTGKNEDGSPKVKNFKGLQAALLKRCILDKETNKYVTVDTIQSWRASVQNELYKRAAELSGVDAEAEDEAGND